MLETNMLHNVQRRNIVRDKYLSQCRGTNIVALSVLAGLFTWRKMIEHSIYYGKNEFYEIIRNIGGTWNDSKERPIVCLIKLSENDNLYWAIPMGNWEHRDEKAKKRIEKYLNYEESDIRSCFYHIGNTEVKSIFFISDIVPITDKYIERSYIGKYTGTPYVIKNKTLLNELIRKAKRILSWENSKPNFYRQHITDIKNYLIEELNKDTDNKQDVAE